jgi:hypothetical protein
MVFKRANVAGVQRKGINKLTLGFASLAAVAVIGTTGIAAAQTSANPGQSGAGYGSNHNTANVELNVHQGGSHNVVNIILNLFQ